MTSSGIVCMTPRPGVDVTQDSRAESLVVHVCRL